MDFYDCKVNLAGERANQVKREGVSAAEIAILRHVHGGSGVEPVEDIVRKSAKKVENAELADSLRQKYGRKAFEEVFGQGVYVELPKAVTGFSARAKKGPKDDQLPNGQPTGALTELSPA
jgi:hypothetical protein